MPVISKATLKPGTQNTDILEAIHYNASSDYQKRVPEATKATLQKTLNHLTDYRPAWNEFVDALINQIGLIVARNNIHWNNPLAKFKVGMLEYGDTIEEINVGLIKARTYNPDREYLERDIFGQYPPEVQTSFHKVNRQEYYPITVNEPLLQRAFVSPEGLGKFVTNTMAAPTTSDQWDEFLITTQLFAEYYRNDGFFKVQVDDVSALDSEAAEAKALIRRIREFTGNLQFLSTMYNASGMPIAVNPDDLELFITPEALAAIDVEALSAAFNIDSANIQARINIIPKEHFGIPGVQAILTTRDFFVIADSRIETSSAWNPVSLSNNMFLHHWEVISASRFVPAILFTTEAGTVVNIVETPVTSVSTITIANRAGDTVTAIERGGLYQVGGNAVTTPEGGYNDAIRLELTGAQSTRTYVTQAGVIHVGPDEAATAITVAGYATDSGDSPQLSATVAVTVVGDLLTLWPASVTPDADKDGLLEATPEALTKIDGKVTIPSVKGVQYKKGGADVTNGSEHTISGSTTFTAVARSGYEIAGGATATWTFTV